MNKKPEVILFALVPVFVLLLFITSGEKIISILEGTKIATWLNVFSYPNSLVFNLSVGYIAGVFIYYLTAYLPNKKIRKYQDIITFKFLLQIEVNLKYLLSTILNPTTDNEHLILSEIIEEKTFREKCKKCVLYGEKSFIADFYNNKPYNLLNIEDLKRRWREIQNTLSEIDFAAIYLNPEIYNWCLELRHLKAMDEFMLDGTQKIFQNGNCISLEFSYPIFYQCHILHLELLEIMNDMREKVHIPRNKHLFFQLLILTLVIPYFIAPL